MLDAGEMGRSKDLRYSNKANCRANLVEVWLSSVYLSFHSLACRFPCTWPQIALCSLISGF